MQDPRLPVSADDMPMRIYHLRHTSGLRQYKVEYAQPVMCRDGVSRRTKHYQCSKTGVEEDSSEGKRLENLARISAFKHAERVGSSPNESAAPAQGRGPLLDGDLIRYHGYADTGHSFYVHAKSVGAMKDLNLWRPAVDTYLPASTFCTNCTYVHCTKSGVETWTCNGHEPLVTGAVATSGETSAAPPLPPPAEFPDEPLKN